MLSILFHVLIGHLCVFFEEMCIQVLCPFSNCVFVELQFLYILGINSLSDRWFADIFSYSVDRLSTLENVCQCTKVLNVLKNFFSPFYFSFCCLCLGAICEKSLPNQCFEDFPKGFNIIILHAGVQFSQYQLLKRSSFPHWVVLVPLLKTHWPPPWGFTSGLPVLVRWSSCLFHARTTLSITVSW